MSYSEIKSLSSEERQANLVAEKALLQKLRFAHALSPIENPMRIQQSRKYIARIKTAQNALRKTKKLAGSDVEKS